MKTIKEIKRYQLNQRSNMRILTIIFLSLLLQQCGSAPASPRNSSIMDSTKKPVNPVYSKTDATPVTITDEEWKKILPKDVYQIAREKGTERPWSSKFETSHEIGTYYCAACGNALFKSDTKFESGCGWPSFYEPIKKESVLYETDNAFGMVRKEVTCGRCKAHLGHLFDDGPPPTGLRYCINGVVLDFEKAQEAEEKYNNQQGSNP